MKVPCVDHQVSIDEREVKKDPSTYVLTTELMLENEYPMPSYLSDTFEKPAGWMESPQYVPGSPSRVIALDCEMVSRRMLGAFIFVSQKFSA